MRRWVTCGEKKVRVIRVGPKLPGAPLGKRAKARPSSSTTAQARPDVRPSRAYEWGSPCTPLPGWGQAVIREWES